MSVKRGFDTIEQNQYIEEKGKEKIITDIEDAK